MSLFRSTTIQYMTSYSDKTALWFHRPTALNQPLFQMPVLGYISGSQALLLFGVGLPILFGMMSIFDVWISVIPFCVIVILSVIRPPVLGYEGRLVVMILFHIKRRQSTPKRRCDALVIPKRKKINSVSTAKKRPPPVKKPMVIKSSGRPVEITMTLRTIENYINRGRVRVLLDGTDIKTAIPSKSGQVSIILHPDDCIGTRRISIHAVNDDDRAGSMLTQKEVVFTQ